MIVWTGRGILSFLVFLLILVGSGLGLPKDYSYYAYVIAAFIAGVFSWFFGVKWNNQDSRIVIDEKTGKRIILKNSHRLFWIEMQYWGIIFWVLGSLFLLYKSLLGSIISIIILLGYILFEYTKQNRTDTEKPTKKVDNKEPIDKEKEAREAAEKEERLRRRQEKEDPNRFMPK